MSTLTTQVTWYVARNPLGQFNCGVIWVDDIADARLHRTIGPAKAAATRWAKENPGERACEVLEWRLDIATATVIDMAGHTKRSLARIEREKQEQEKRNREWRLKELERKEREVVMERAALGPVEGKPVWKNS